MPPLHPSVRCTIDGRPFESFAGIDRSAAPEPLAGRVLEWVTIDDPDANEPPIYFTIAPPRSVFDAIALEMENAIAYTADEIGRDMYRPGDHVLGQIIGLGGALALPAGAYATLAQFLDYPPAVQDDRVDALAYSMQAIAAAHLAPIAEVGAAITRFAAETARRPPFRLDIEDDTPLHPAGIACWKCHRTHSPQAACRR